jgi:hypothetical protein
MGPRPSSDHCDSMAHSRGGTGPADESAFDFASLMCLESLVRQGVARPQPGPAREPVAEVDGCRRLVSELGNAPRRALIGHGRARVDVEVKSSVEGAAC